MMLIIYFCLGIQPEDQKPFTDPWISCGRIASLPVSWLTFHSTCSWSPTISQLPRMQIYLILQIQHIELEKLEYFCVPEYFPR